jgi:hypothetical protein
MLTHPFSLASDKVASQRSEPAGLGSELASVDLFPSQVVLDRARATQSIVVMATFTDGRTQDVTASAKVEVAPPQLATYEAECFVPQKDGSGVVNVSFGGRELSAPIKVVGASINPPVEFRNEVMQVMTKAGCNSGKCHGSASGKDGFRLSLFGYDPEGDHFRLTRELIGRRIQLSIPEQSLLLLKATGEVPHTGGQCVDSDSDEYEILRQWLREGAKWDADSTPVPTSIDVYPKQSVFARPSGEQKLIVMANFTDGSQRDVTGRSVFLSNNEATAQVDERGMVKAKGPGASFVLVRFDKFTQGSSIVVRPGGDYRPSFPEAHNEIDRLVDRRLRHLHIEPSKLSSDEQFLRRVTLDLIGQLPSLEAYASFMQDKSPDKRSSKIDELIRRPEFRDIWIMRWAELLQIRTANGLSPKGLKLYDQWLRESVHDGATIDKIVKAILPAKGGTLQSPEANYYQTETTPQLIAESVAQVFMGTRIQCAQCHNHPFDRWTMDDYYGFADFFSQVGYKQSSDPRELTIFNAGEGSIEHPVAGRKVVPRFLGDLAPANVSGRDYRDVVAEWLASTENDAFCKNIGNIVWSHFFGIGVVEPVDDVRVSNPASNPDLLAYLGKRISDSHFEIEHLVREICNSRSYQIATRRTDLNRLDEKEFSHQKIRRVRAEVLLDCLCQATDTTEKLPGLPLGSKAVQVADGQAAHYFLNTFGRSNRNSPCTCEVKTSPTLSQALHLLNGETTSGKIKEGKVIERLLDQGNAPLDVARTLYRKCFTRECIPVEMKEIQARLSTYPNATDGLEDLFWALLNSNEFIFNH